MIKVYIAGGITKNKNYMEQFSKAEIYLKEMGCAVLNPCKNEGFSYKDYIDMGLCELMKCEAIYLLKGYEDSHGAMLEKSYAELTGMTILYE